MYSIQGSVLADTGQGSFDPRSGVRVEFRPIDSLSVSSSIYVATSNDSGLFTIQNVPGERGLLLYYQSAQTLSPLAVDTLEASEVEQSASLPAKQLSWTP